MGIKLLRAKFENFRLLRDLELEFSRDPRKKLTVIRAANESGKTTILHALQWALYGDEALPNKGVGFRLHPIDWEAGEGKRVPITATVEYETTDYWRISGEMRETRRRYHLVRTAHEYVDSQARRPASTVKLFKLNDTGAEPIPAPDSEIKDKLPPELREVFFTDGDRALSFIEADAAASPASAERNKRKRVENAISSLLRLGLIDDAIKHVKNAEKEANRKMKQFDPGSDLDRTTQRIEVIDHDEEKEKADLEHAKQEIEKYAETVDGIEHDIQAAVPKEDLKKELEDAKREKNSRKEELADAKQKHSELFQSREIADDLLAPVLGPVFEKLDALRDQGKIPHTTIPVLEDRLSAEFCICGESLKPGGSDSDKRRDHIRKLIDDSRRADEIQEIITGLYFGAKPLQGGGEPGASAWLKRYDEMFGRWDRIQTQLKEAGRKLSALEDKLKALPNKDIQCLYKARTHYRGWHHQRLGDKRVIEMKLKNLREERQKLEGRQRRLLWKQEKGERAEAELDVAQDVMKVLQSAKERIKKEELPKVSELMNRIFLEMIAADPKQGAIIRRAEISEDFDIIVHGPNGRTLNPDRDLNGASRRALTLAFILALTKVSEVEAPNVIDTPLGMTSGFIRRSILRTAARESAQLILFLTHDEIAGCEEIIDETAGMMFTLTNSAHYPKMLMNDPGVAEPKVLRCECDHRCECQLCLRRADAQVEPETAS